MFGTTKAPVLTIGVVGLGLIGGSMAKALKKYTNHRILGCDIDEATIREALSSRSIDQAAAPADLSGCEVVLLALYPQQTVLFVKEHLDCFRPGCILVDLCGVKRYTVDSLTGLCAEKGLTFIGGHPMAGKECWGFSGADAELYAGASMILTPDGRTPQAALYLLTVLFAAVGFSTITTATPAEHDSMIAFTSQLAHIVSSAYIKSPRAQQHAGFSAGSYKDLTRVAKLNPKMWTELFLENGDYLVEEIDEITRHLQEYREAIVTKDAPRLYQLLEDGRRKKEALQ